MVSPSTHRSRFALTHHVCFPSWEVLLVDKPLRTIHLIEDTTSPFMPAETCAAVHRFAECPIACLANRYLPSNDAVVVCRLPCNLEPPV